MGFSFHIGWMNVWLKQPFILKVMISQIIFCFNDVGIVLNVVVASLGV